MNNILTEREYNVPGNWYSPKKFLESFPSVICVKLWNTCSSAGDWTGYIVQKIGKISYLIPFSQSNNWPRGGFTLFTGNIVASWHDFTMGDDELDKIIVEHELMYA